MTRGKRRLLLGLLALLLLGLLVLAITLSRPSAPAARPPEQGPLLRPRALAPQIVVGFWNIRDFSAASRSREELALIARVAHRMDCLAICELNDTQVLRGFTRELAALGGEWEGIQTPSKTGNTPGSSEYYGFVFRSDKLRIRSPPRILPERTYVSYRKAEIRALRDYFQQVQDEDPGDQDVILGGDFNRDVGDESFAELLSIPSMVDTTDPAPPTVVRGASTYDHILFERRYVTEYEGVHGVEAFDETLFGGDAARARTAVSDHRPVWIVLRVPERDDD